MYDLPNAEPERSAAADAYYAIGRAMLTGLSHSGAMWAPGVMLPPYVPVTRSPKAPTAPSPEPAPVAVPSRVRAPRLSIILRRLAG